MALLEFLFEIFVQAVWEGVLRFVGACVRFVFTREDFQRSFQNNNCPLIGLGVVFLIIFLFFWNK
jgi:hypothetical protein